MSNTLAQFELIFEKCKNIFTKKNKDYGTAWRILRPSSLTDQIFIKANRIRTIQETKETKVNEGVDNEFVGIINYCIMGLTQLELKEDNRLELSLEEVVRYYNKYASMATELMIKKNHDYGEVWRKMRVSSITDLILMKLLRIKQIEDNKGATVISEGIDANYLDVVNYAIFALIRLSEETENSSKEKPVSK